MSALLKWVTLMTNFAPLPKCLSFAMLVSAFEVQRTCMSERMGPNIMWVPGGLSIDLVIVLRIKKVSCNS